MAEQNESQAGSGLQGVDIAPGDERAREAEGAADGGAGEGSAAELESARREIAELKENWQRERADFMNFRKRTMQERSRLRLEAFAGFAHELLDVVDNLERTLATPAESDETRSFKAGVEMIHKGLLGAFEKQGIQSIHPQGLAFDPNLMEAIASEDSEEHDVDTVIEVYQAGYMIEYEPGARHTIRPARVRVARARRPAAGQGEQV